MDVLGVRVQHASFLREALKTTSLDRRKVFNMLSNRKQALTRPRRTNKGRRRGPGMVRRDDHAAFEV